MAYHYTESGLDNVWLEGGVNHTETAYGPGTTIENLDALHSAIGGWLIDLPRPLTGAELRFIRVELDLSQRDLGGLLGIEEQALRRWEKARTKSFNGAADRMLRSILADHLKLDKTARAIAEHLSELDQVDVTAAYFVRQPHGWYYTSELVPA